MSKLYVEVRPPRGELTDNLDLGDIDAYIEGIERALNAEAASLGPQRGQDLEVAITLLQLAQIAVQLRSSPGMDRASLRRLAASVTAVPAPSGGVWPLQLHGAIALWGGTGASLASARIDSAAPGTIVELRANNGWTILTLTLRPLLLQGDRFLHQGSLSVAVSHWGRKMRLIGEYSSNVPDYRIVLSDALFRDDALRELGAALLMWSELDFARLPTSPLQLDVTLCDPGRASTRMLFDPAPDHPRGDRADCTLIHASSKSSTSQRSSLTFRVDLSGIHRFASDLLEALGPSDVE